VASIKLFLGLLELGLLFLNLLLEDHLHLGLHLGKFGLVQSPLFLQPRGRARETDQRIYQGAVNRNLLDFLEHGRVLGDTHAEQLLRSPVLVQHIVSVLAQLLHVRADEHLAELDKVAVLLIVNLNNTPGVGTAANLTTIGSVDKVVRANNSKRNLAGNLLCLRNSFLVLVVIRRCLENVDVVMSNVG